MKKALGVVVFVVIVSILCTIPILAAGPCSKFDIDQDGKVTALDWTKVGEIVFLGNNEAIRTPNTITPPEETGFAQVSLHDLSTLAAHFGLREGDEDWDPRFDFNRNGVVDQPDYEILRAVYSCLDPDVNGDGLVDIRDIAAIMIAAEKNPFGR